jgi:hypothetical protein
MLPANDKPGQDSWPRIVIKFDRERPARLLFVFDQAATH